MRNRLVGLVLSILIVFLMSPVSFAQKIPRTQNGKPDLSGVWAGPGFTYKPGAKFSSIPDPRNIDFGETGLPFKPGGEELWKRKPNGDLLHDDPTALCLPWGFPAEPILPRAQQFFLTPQALVIIYEDFRMYRIIPLDGRPHPKDLEESYMGHSVGHWEGDTLVVDVVGLKAWESDARDHMHTEQAHYIERFRRTGPDTMSYELTTDDPGIFTRPWTKSWTMHLKPDWELLEEVCEDNNLDVDLIKNLKK